MATSTAIESPEETSVHIPYDLEVRPYHSVIADLVQKYSPNNGRILDVGCGVGNTLELVRRRNSSWKLVGADIDQRCLNLTSERVRLDQAIKLDDVLDIAAPSLNVGTYDIIIMSHVLEHVTRPYDTVKILMDMLNYNGYLILAVPNPVRPDVAVFNLFRRFEKVNKGHVQTWDRAHWKNFLEVILDLNVVEYPTDFIRVPRLDRYAIVHPVLMLMARLFPGFARSCMAVVRKT